VVMMTSQANQSVVLRKGEEMIYIKSRDEFIKSAVSDTNAVSYKTKIFVFENASLDAVVQKLNEVYGSNIVLSGDIRSCRLTATFKNESADEVIEIIAETLQLSVKNNGDTLILEGTGCEE
jgi:transmembrane sensor